MYESHSLFIQPDNEDIKIWRYMDFTKFISLIDTSKLFFTRGDNFDDPLEGSWPKKNVEERANISYKLLIDDPKKHIEAVSNTMKKFSKYFAINCWHENEYESAAMWKLYLKSNEGIAIQSNYRQFKESIIDEEKVYIGKVKYIDYETDYIRSHNSFSAFLHKRKSFEHEKEIRAIINKFLIEEDPNSDFDNLNLDKETIINGLPILVDLKILIQNIYISPSTPIWFSDLVGKVIKKYGYDFNIVHSQIYSSPLF